MRKIGYSVYSVFLLILSAVLLVIWFFIFKNIDLGPSRDGLLPGLLAIFFPILLLLEYFVKVNDLFKSNFSYRSTLIFIWGYNAIYLLIMLAACGYERPAWKVCYLSMTLAMSIPDLILTIKLLKDRAKEKRLRENKENNKNITGVR